ncbi:MAG TPA: phosphoribosyl-AMP cyclohydrolase [Fibrobacteria bacterium]|nr:phosphoribosyl-AMP cyclohydrolase [Fibrobacteria bacterium]HOX51438.1 phosphoribosyl-AMP cyclohydrolase [Fibrobacteria bacterium]
MKPLVLSPDQARKAAESVKFDNNGLALAIACDHASGEILMVAWMNRQTLEQTLSTGRMTYWSRSRGEVWVKGLTSGHLQDVVGVELDCDGDALRFRVVQHGGAACHTGRRSCFFRTLSDGSWKILSEAPSPD